MVISKMETTDRLLFMRDQNRQGANLEVTCPSIHSEPELPRPHGFAVATHN